MIYHHSAHHMSFKKFPDGVSTIYKSHIMSCSEVFKKTHLVNAVFLLFLLCYQDLTGLLGRKHFHFNVFYNDQ